MSGFDSTEVNSLRDQYETHLYEEDLEPLNKSEKLIIDMFVDWMKTR